MKALSWVLLALLAGCANQAPIALKQMGSFHIGGREVEISGKSVKEIGLAPGGVPATIDPNGKYLVESMYVPYFLPVERRGAVPMLMWHGGGLTGVTYETKPDGGEGWLTWFLKKGWDVYNSDAVERGRAGWAMYPDIFTTEPVFLPVANPWERFRIGPDGKSLIYSGVIEDPVYLARPVEWSGQWLYRPNMPHSNEKCDLEVARKFLGDFK